MRDAQGRAYATGKRKDAVARVWIKPGSGKVTVNGKEQDVYFARPVLQMILRQPFQVAGVEGQFDVMATVAGGGLSGQAGAVKHGISKALQLYDPVAALAAQGRRFPDPRLAARSNGRNTASARRAAASSSRSADPAGRSRPRLSQDTGARRRRRAPSFPGMCATLKRTPRACVPVPSRA